MSNATDPRLFRSGSADAAEQQFIDSGEPIMKTSTRRVRVPGDTDPDLSSAELVETPPSDLRQELIATRNELAAIKSQLATMQRGGSLQALAVFEPVTPHGARQLAESRTAHLTVAELMARIDAGHELEPETSTLCKDGWYASRGAA